MIDPSKLQPGDRVWLRDGEALARAVVHQVTENYIALNWGLKPFTARNDIILKTSPLWQILELV